jgi:hypothetical protein
MVGYSRNKRDAGSVLGHHSLYVFITAVPITKFSSCLRGGRGIVEDMSCQRGRAEDCVN